MNDFVYTYSFSLALFALGYFFMKHDDYHGMRASDIVKLKLRKLKYDYLARAGAVLCIIGLLIPFSFLLSDKNWSLFYLAIMLFICFSVLFLLFRKKTRNKPMIRGDSLEIIKSQVVEQDELREKLWQIYNASFLELNERTPCRQSFDKEHFMDLLLSPTVLKYLISTRNGDGLICIGLISNDFSNTPWISEDYFRCNFKDYFEKKLIFYFLGIAVEKNFRNQGFASLLIKRIVEELPPEAVIGFDHSENANFFVPKLTRIVNQGRKTSKKYLDSQNYYIVQRE